MYCRDGPQWASPRTQLPHKAEQLNRETAIPAPEQTALRNGTLHITLTQNALVLIQVENSKH
jgi:xylan 1,4-beta-xylosidase